MPLSAPSFRWPFGLSLWTLVACSGGGDRLQPAELDQESPSSVREETAIDPCASPRSGCPCEDEGASLECGVVTERRGPYDICSMGTRVCVQGIWSECGVARPGEGLGEPSGSISTSVP